MKRCAPQQPWALARRLALAPLTCGVSTLMTTRFERPPNYLIGSFVFTALAYDEAGEMRWNVVSLFKDPTNIKPAQRAAKLDPIEALRHD